MQSLHAILWFRSIQRALFRLPQVLFSKFRKNQVTKKEEIDPKAGKAIDSDFHASRKETVDDIKEELPQPEEKPAVDRKRCFDCKKKVGLLGVECKCGFVFCNKHRLP